jgi:hypothetical protein
MRTLNSSRRSFVKLVAAAPLLSQIAARDLLRDRRAVAHGLPELVLCSGGINPAVGFQG